LITRLPKPGRGNSPQCHTAEIGGLGVNINPGNSISTGAISADGARRYRVKVFSTLGPVDVHARDIRFARDATVWEDVNLGATVAAPGGFRLAANFGEGTAVMLTLGTCVQIRCTNAANPGAVRVVRFEFWIGY
jgi:hypothetical protein